MRCFVAVELPLTVQQSLAVLQTQLRAALGTTCGLTWVRAEHAHLTLRFFAEVADDRLAVLQEGLAAAAATLIPIVTQCDTLGVFPEAGPPRVIWAGVSTGRDQITSLYQRLTEELEQRGWPADDQAFHAHVTLARTQSGVARAPLLAALSQCRLPPECRFPVERLTLMQSILTPHGPLYTLLYRTNPRTAS